MEVLVWKFDRTPGTLGHMASFFKITSSAMNCIMRCSCLATAAELASIYVPLMAQPSTDAAFQKMISESSLSPASVKGIAGEKLCPHLLRHAVGGRGGETSQNPLKHTSPNSRDNWVYP